MLSRFFSYYRPHRRLFVIDFSFALIVGLLELGFPLAVQWFIDKLLPGGEWNLIIAVSIALLILYILAMIMQYVVNYWGHKLGINIETDMREELFGHIHKQSFRFFDNHKTGHLMSRVTNDLFDIGELAHHGPEDFVIAVMTLLGAFGIMFSINPDLAFVTIVAIPFLIVMITYANKNMSKAWRQMYRNIGDVNARVEDSVAGARVVQSFTNEAFEIERFRKDNAFYRRSKIEAYRVMSTSLAGIYMTTRLMTLLVLVYGAYLTYEGQLTYGELVGFVLYMNLMIKPVEKITALLEMYPKGMAGFQRFVQLLDESPDVEDKPGALSVERLHGDIRFRDVSFGYSEHREVLRGINLDITAGTTVALVGTSGAGKTTICSLIPRFYDVTNGSITIDDIDVRDMTKLSLRRQIGIVQQDVFLFAGTLRENIAYGRLEASESELMRAVEQAHLSDLVATLEHGLDTEIGERGLKLSGGQKQRIAIARMFLKNPPLLILDEATSALDTATEEIIQQSLNELAVNRTTLIIAHRLATVRDADRILVVTEDGIVEDGAYEELRQRNGIFADLLRRQQL